jgi:hypothetical protein
MVSKPKPKGIRTDPSRKGLECHRISAVRRDDL